MTLSFHSLTRLFFILFSSFYLRIQLHYALIILRGKEYQVGVTDYDHLEWSRMYCITVTVRFVRMASVAVIVAIAGYSNAGPGLFTFVFIVMTSPRL